MKNFEKFKTAEERMTEFEKYCKVHKKCAGCGLISHESYTIASCAFAWLDIEVEPERAMDCPFCGGEVEYREMYGKVWFHCDKCEYSSAESDSEDKAIDAHNRICRAVKAAKEGEVR